MAPSGGKASRPYKVEFPGATVDDIWVRRRAQNARTLESALYDVRHTLYRVWKEDPGAWANDADIGLITNRDTGYRWIMRRPATPAYYGRPVVEFQTPEMLAEEVASDSVDAYLSVEEAEALADAADTAVVSDKRSRAVLEQAIGQLRLLVNDVREGHRRAETRMDWRGSLNPDKRSCWLCGRTVTRSRGHDPRPIGPQSVAHDKCRRRLYEQMHAETAANPSLTPEQRAELRSLLDAAEHPPTLPVERSRS